MHRPRVSLWMMMKTRREMLRMLLELAALKPKAVGTAEEALDHLFKQNTSTCICWTAGSPDLDGF